MEAEDEIRPGGGHLRSCFDEDGSENKASELSELMSLFFVEQTHTARPGGR